MFRVPPFVGEPVPGFSPWNPAAPAVPPVDDVPPPPLLQAAASSAMAARAVTAPKPREDFRIETLLLLILSAKFVSRVQVPEASRPTARGHTLRASTGDHAKSRDAHRRCGGRPRAAEWQEGLRPPRSLARISASRLSFS